MKRKCPVCEREFRPILRFMASKVEKRWLCSRDCKKAFVESARVGLGYIYRN